MRFDLDLVREILIFFESDRFEPLRKYSVETFIDENVFPDAKDPFSDELSPFEREYVRVWKHIHEMINAGLIEGQEINMGRAGCSNYLFSMNLHNASGLTFAGQSYLDQLRNDTVFNRFKDKVKKHAIPVTTALAPNLVSYVLGL